MDKTDHDLTTVLLCIFLVIVGILALIFTAAPAHAASVDNARYSQTEPNYYYLRGTFSITQDDYFVPEGETISVSCYISWRDTEYYVSKIRNNDGSTQFYSNDCSIWLTPFLPDGSIDSQDPNAELLFEFCDDCPAVRSSIYDTLYQCGGCDYGREFYIYNWDGSACYAALLAGSYGRSSADGAPSLSFTSASLSIVGGCDGEWSFCDLLCRILDNAS